MKNRERTGHLLAPSALLALAPFELLALFTVPAGGDEIDPLAELARHNRDRAAKGRQPTVPSWLMPTVPRRRSTRRG